MDGCHSVSDECRPAETRQQRGEIGWICGELLWDILFPLDVRELIFINMYLEYNKIIDAKSIDVRKSYRKRERERERERERDRECVCNKQQYRVNNHVKGIVLFTKFENVHQKYKQVPYVMALQINMKRSLPKQHYSMQRLIKFHTGWFNKKETV